MTEQVKAVAKAYGKYLAVLGGATGIFLMGFVTYHVMVFLPVVERFK